MAVLLVTQVIDLGVSTYFPSLEHVVISLIVSYMLHFTLKQAIKMKGCCVDLRLLKESN